MASTVPDISVSPASPKEIKAEVESNSDQTSAPKVANGTVSHKKTSETRRRFPFPFKKEFSPLLRRKNQRANKKHSSTEDMNDISHRDSLIEDGSVSDSNEDEEGVYRSSLARYFIALHAGMNFCCEYTVMTINASGTCV